MSFSFFQFLNQHSIIQMPKCFRLTKNLEQVKVLKNHKQELEAKYQMLQKEVNLLNQEHQKHQRKQKLQLLQIKKKMDNLNF